MPKLKTNKSAAKRFRITKNGKFKRSASHARHLKTSKSAKRRKNLRKGRLISAADVAHVRRLLPYS